MLNLETRYMRDNLLFSGLIRSFKTNGDGQEYEDTEAATLREFLEKEMVISEQILFERVHSIGRVRYGKPPLIVAKLSAYKDRVRKTAATKLRGKDN
ncbi:hypothetical protein KUTeg_003986 [Tegillarca granosa]|uniref:Uncharacterized protein n=1 Tax=Tegillarca granosa TaxID=220873 RepID=A0ABQ9FRI6_TEGGR|nr:hypothetical protein KUTeg_003986 [Tegillarca granosa]